MESILKGIVLSQLNVSCDHKERCGCDWFVIGGRTPEHEAKLLGLGCGVTIQVWI